MFLSTSVISTHIYVKCMYKIFLWSCRKNQILKFHRIYLTALQLMNLMFQNPVHSGWWCQKNYAKILQLIDNVSNNGYHLWHNRVWTMKLLIILHILKPWITFKESVPYLIKPLFDKIKVISIIGQFQIQGKKHIDFFIFMDFLNMQWTCHIVIILDILRYHDHVHFGLFSSEPQAIDNQLSNRCGTDILTVCQQTSSDTCILMELSTKRIVKFNN